MTDLDVNVPNLHRRWWSSFRLAEGRHPIESVVDAVLTALTNAIRQGGLPCLNEIQGIVAAAYAKELSEVDASHDLDALVRASGGSLHVRIGVQAAKKMVVSAGKGNPCDFPDAAMVAEAFCVEFVKSGFIDLATPKLQERLELPEEEAWLWREQLHAALREKAARIAQDLVDDPSGKGVRKPPVRGRKWSTVAESLEWSLTGEVR